jgi:hypothetical protein
LRQGHHCCYRWWAWRHAMYSVFHQQRA